MPSTQPKQPSERTLDCQSENELCQRENKHFEAVHEEGEADANVCTAGNTYYIEIKIGKKRCSGLLDTGSEVTLLPKQLADVSQLTRSSRKLRAANGTVINIVGEWRTVVKMGPLNVAMNFVVSDQIDEILIGIDWLREHRCLLSFAELTITLRDYCFPMLKKVNSGSCNRVISEEKVTLPAKSKAVIPSKVVYSNLHRPLPSLCVTDSIECRPGVKTARCLLNIGEGTNLPLRVMNINNEAVTLPAGTMLCPLREVEAVLEPIVAHVDKLKKCVTLNEFDKVRVVQQGCVCSFQRMPKRKANKETATEPKTVNCSECGKAFRSLTDVNRHVDMVHLLKKHDCHHCEVTLGSVSALRRHLEKQHRMKLSTRPKMLSSDQWRLVPVDVLAPTSTEETPSARHEPGTEKIEMLRVRATRSAPAEPSSVSLPDEEDAPRPSDSTSEPVVVGFSANEGYLVTDAVQVPERNLPVESGWMNPPPAELELEGRRQFGGMDGRTEEHFFAHPQGELDVEMAKPNPTFGLFHYVCR